VKPTKTLVAADREAWREWLAANHQSAKQIWLVYFKKSGKRAGTGVAYEDSVEEALCFGWIDSLIKKIDATKYARLFTPRVDDENWSASNRKRVAKVIAEGRMTPAGLAKASFLRKSVRAAAPRKRPDLVMPDYMKRSLRASKRAWENYNRLAPSYQRQYIGWITTAKKEETRQRRLAEAVALLAENRKLGLK
jgi:uncharacterized protein YdeI (YjbR/CyaY-like superfamily)